MTTSEPALRWHVVAKCANWNHGCCIKTLGAAGIDIDQAVVDPATGSARIELGIEAESEERARQDAISALERCCPESTVTVVSPTRPS
jgi:hypothetical protein